MGIPKYILGGLPERMPEEIQEQINGGISEGIPEKPIVGSREESLKEPLNESRDERKGNL